jgi:hypothetical protein
MTRIRADERGQSDFTVDIAWRVSRGQRVDQMAALRNGSTSEAQRDDPANRLVVIRFDPCKFA